MGCRSRPSAAAPSIMDELAPLGPVYQAGTLSGNPLATAAGLAALAELDDAVVRASRTDRTAVRRRPAEGLRGRRRRRADHAGVHARRPVLRDPTGHELRRGASAPITRATRASSTACSTGRVLRPERLRNAVPEPGAHRRRHRSDPRSCRGVAEPGITGLYDASESASCGWRRRGLGACGGSCPCRTAIPRTRTP